MNISLIGMMGSGKTTIAKILADILSDFSLVDTDEKIIENECCSINEIFSKKGEAEFRKIETTVLKNILKNDNQIISTGGGIITSDENISMLKNNSIVFFLDADEETLYNRVKNNKERPLLNNGDMKDKIHKLLEQRIQKYKNAHYIINTNNKYPKEIAEEIIRKSGINGNS